MAKKNITFAEQAKKVKNKYYKTRKPGEDQMTDDAFNREMEGLMLLQESVKPPESNEQEFSHGGSIHIKPENRGKFTATKKATGKTTKELTHSKNPLTRKRAIFAQNAAKWNHKNGGNLPKYDGLSTGSNFLRNTAGPRVEGLSVDTYDPYSISRMTPKGANLQMPNVPMDLMKSSTTPNPNMDSMAAGSYSPTANALIPATTAITGLIASSLAAKNARRRKDKLLSGINVNLGRVGAEKIDLSRERADIRANQATSEAGGRYLARNARSASEAAKIANMARLGGQRTAGSLLGQSLEREELTNAQLRQRANERNQELMAQESMMENQQRQAIEQQYGGIEDSIWPQYISSLGQSAANYMAENQKMRDYYSELNMRNPNYQLDFQQNYEKLSPTKQRLSRLGFYNPGYKKVITDGKI